MQKKCLKCHDFGRRQIYKYGRVMSVYCSCKAGRDWVQKLKEDFISKGIDITDPHYPWNQDPED
jgi:hypothetical protein